MADEEKQEEVAAEAPAAEAPAAEEKKPKAKAKKTSANLDAIIESIKGLSVMELADLVHALEDEFGVSAAAPVAMAAAPAAEAAEVEEKTEFNVVLKDFGANKINVIKAVRELTSLGLKESKDLVEGVPSNVKENVGKDEAAAAKTKLEAAGATVDIT